jgi:hypothetical protein
MKKFATLILLTILMQACCQEKSLIESPKVDKRVELISIVFRLADNQEYNSSHFTLYTNKIEQYFAPYKNHELIQFAKRMRNDKSISYDAPMSLAVLLDDNLNLPKEISGSSLERWDKDDAVEFVRLLKVFYEDARCDIFFDSRQKIYDEIAERFSSVYKNIDLNWYGKFYGKEPIEKFKIVIALGNGGHCYGPSFIDSNGVKEVYAVMGVWNMDDSGMPIFVVNNYLPILIHEFNHSFVNPLLDKNKEIFRENGEKILEAMKYEMSIQQAYGVWETVLNEALVRASVIKYYKDHHAEQKIIDNLVNYELSNGFIWIKELVGELENYNTNRETYSTLESYMPKLAEAYDSYAKQVKQFDSNRPQKVSP